MDIAKRLHQITLHLIAHVHQRPAGNQFLLSILYAVALPYKSKIDINSTAEMLCGQRSATAGKTTAPSVTWARTVPIPASPYRFFRSMFDSSRRRCQRYYGIDCQGDRVPALCICNFPLIILRDFVPENALRNARSATRG